MSLKVHSPSRLSRARQGRFPLRRIAGGALAWAAGLAVMACGEGRDPRPDPDATVLAPTWCADVQPLIQSRCLGCHSVTRAGSLRNGAPAGVNFDTYEDASPMAGTMNELIQAGVMPPAGPLSETEQRLFWAWVATGRPEGSCE